ncbi:MAG: hypothetical protein OXC66_00085 [Roseovarius sp.]|nr:hypothetical protein [Roseovarius sp.]
MEMNDPKDPIHELDKHLAVLEEKVEKTLAKNESAIDRLRVDIANSKTDAEKRDKEAIQREKENHRWIIGLVLACTGIVVAAVALL